MQEAASDLLAQDFSLKKSIPLCYYHHRMVAERSGLLTDPPSNFAQSSPAMASSADAAPSAAAAARASPGGTTPLPTTHPMTPGASTAPGERGTGRGRHHKRRARTESPASRSRSHSSDRSETAGGPGGWRSAVPGNDCSISDLRWFVVCEMLPAMNNMKQMVETLKVEMKTKPNKDDVDAMLKAKPDRDEVSKTFNDGAAKFVMKDSADHSNPNKGELDKLSEWVKEQAGKTTHDAQALAAEVKKLTNDLNKYADHVDRLIHEKVGVVKNDLDEISNRMNEHCSKAVHETQALKGKTDKLTDDLNKYADQVGRLIREKIGVVKNDLDEISNRMNEHCSKAVHGRPQQVRRRGQEGLPARGAGGAGLPQPRGASLRCPLGGNR